MLVITKIKSTNIFFGCNLFQLIFFDFPVKCTLGDTQFPGCIFSSPFVFFKGFADKVLFFFLQGKLFFKDFTIKEVVVIGLSNRVIHLYRGLRRTGLGFFLVKVLE